MKKELRKKLKLLRDKTENRVLRDSIIADAFLTSDLYNKAETLLLYYSSGSEVSTIRILRQALDDGKTVAFPVCLDSKGTMRFYIINSENDLVDGMYGIKAPSDGCKEFTEGENVLCVVPGLAFDKHGYRIGYGKGYYDRFLSAFRGMTVGLCYEQLVYDSLPYDIYDKQVNYLITDKKTYNLKSFKEDFKNG